jgi:uncharacterized linocin/CFP29 family protein
MADSNVQLPWTDDQWYRIRQVVYEEARAARVAGNFLPLFGPLGADAAYVPQETVNEPGAGNPGDQVPGFTVSDTETLKLSTLQVKVFLRSAQVADPELKSALIAFRRGANVLARLEDEIIFNGQPRPDEGPNIPGGATNLCEVQGGQSNPGLLDGPGGAPGPMGVSATIGEKLVSDVSRAVGALERRFHLGPFACVLDHKYFQAVQTPNGSLVLPQDRILPFLGGGPLVRSSALPDDTGLVIALVVATDISVGFLQVTAEAWSVFRIYEKIVLRIKEPDAIERISGRRTKKRKGGGPSPLMAPNMSQRREQEPQIGNSDSK